MPDLTWTLAIQLGAGVTVTTNGAGGSAEAIDRVEATVEAGASGKVIELQPSAADQVKLLHIRASAYSDKLEVVVSDGSADSDAIALTEPQLFTQGAMGLFGVAPKQLKVSNSGPEPVKVEVIAARDATP